MSNLTTKPINIAPVGRDFPSARPKDATVGPKGEFSELLRAQVETPSAPLPQSGSPSALKFSTHAIDRMRSRNILMAPEDLANIAGAVQKAEQKGSKNTLVLHNDSAWIVNVPNKMVITVMDKAMLKENVFTNIDSTIVL